MLAEYPRGTRDPGVSGYPEAPVGDGAIRPTHFLGRRSGPERPAAGMNYAFDGVEPHLLALEEGGGRAYVALAGGELAVLNLRGLVMEKRISLGSEPTALTPGPAAGAVYAALSGGELRNRYGKVKRNSGSLQKSPRT